MKTIRPLAALVFAFALCTSVSAFAGQDANPDLVARHTSRIRTIQKSLAGEGYSLQSVEEQPIYYIVPPTTPYVWGTLIYTYTRTSNGQVDEAKLSLQVQTTADGSFAFPEIMLREHLAE